MAAAHEPWQTALLVVALLSVFIIGAIIYWLTSKQHKIRVMQRKLGYIVPSMWSYFTWCCVCCTGPLLRNKWEREHMYYRSDEYAVLKKERPTTEKLMDLTSGAEWTKLPRGDQNRHRNVVHAALARVRAHIMHEVLETAIEGALKTIIADARQNREQERQFERIRAAAARWRGMAQPDLHKQRQREIEALMGEGDGDSSDDDDGPSFFGCDLGFLKLAPRGAARAPPQKSRNNPVVSRSKAPIIMGNWGDGGGNGGRAAADGGGGGSSGGRGHAVASSAGADGASATAGWGGAMAWGDPSAVVNPHARRQPKFPVPGSKPLSVVELKRVVRDMTEQNIRPEFDSIPLNVPRGDLLSPVHERYTTNLRLFPFPDARVRLEQDGRFTYINASYMRGPDGDPGAYIATQVPLAETNYNTGKHKTAADFWLMVYKHRAPAVLLLDSDVQPFWPIHEGRAETYGELSVTLQGDFHGKDFNEVVLTVAGNKRQRSHRVSLLVFYLWQAGKNPEPSPLLAMLKFANIITRREQAGPMVFADIDGGDRVGISIALDRLMYQVKRTGVVDIMRTVADVREDRGGLISTAGLYMLLHSMTSTYALAIGAGPAPPAYVMAPGQQ